MVKLRGIPETMLWTLHNRATESEREDGCLKDSEAERIHRAIEYDFITSFGEGEPSHALRSVMFDGYLNSFLAENPDGVIVNLGEGLETQRFRVKGDRALWITVDLPEAMAVREKYINPDENHIHIEASALDKSWYDAVPEGRSVYITAQGLLMYFTEKEVSEHLRSLATRFPGAWYAFDTIPRWLSKKSTSRKGFWKTPAYRSPAFPWGINRYEIRNTVKAWIPAVDKLHIDAYLRFPRGVNRYFFYVISRIPVLRGITPVVVRLHFQALPSSTQ